jgi:signal peptidase I
VAGDGETHELNWKTPLVRGRIVLTSLLMASACYGFFTWVLWPVKVAGRSMTPTFADGSRHFINKLAYLSARPQRGDVIALRADDGDVYLKRIVGLPGEVISFEDGVLHINDVPVKEPYTRTRVPVSWRQRVHLGPDEYYVIGDNRAISVLAPIPGSRIIGKVAF